MNTLLLDYWRQSIADTQRLSPPISGANVHEIDAICIQDGRIPAEIAEQLVAEHRREIHRKNDDIDIEKIKTAPIAVTPFILLEKLEHTQARKRGQQSEAAAIWLIGAVNETGNFRPPQISLRGLIVPALSLSAVGHLSLVVSRMLIPT